MPANQPKDPGSPRSLAPYLSPAAAWALSVGTSIG
jgi:hypothetical protein